VIGSEVKLTINGLTDVGRVRDGNEDSIAWDARLGLIMLADGMGGHNAGEVASAMAVETIKSALQDVLAPEIQAADIIDYHDAVREAVTFANQEIHEQAQMKSECAGMGTTIVLGLFRNDSVILAHVGDSRIYRYRQGELEQMTSDHSLVQEMVDSGYLSQEEAQQSASKNLITRALGIAPEVDVDVREVPLQRDDIFLMCSDGLSDLVSRDDISSVISDAGQDMQRAAQELVNLANERGGTDNISVILVNMTEAFSDERGLEPSTDSLSKP
jgi:protein phosphatase